MTEKKNYNKTIIAMWDTKGGNSLSMEIDERALEQIREFAKNVEIGGKLLIKRLSPETREKFRGGPEKAPNCFLEYITADNVAEYKASRNKPRDNVGL